MRDRQRRRCRHEAGKGRQAAPALLPVTAFGVAVVLVLVVPVAVLATVAAVPVEVLAPVT